MRGKIAKPRGARASFKFCLLSVCERLTFDVSCARSWERVSRGEVSRGAMYACVYCYTTTTRCGPLRRRLSSSARASAASRGARAS